MGASAENAIVSNLAGYFITQNKNIRSTKEITFMPYCRTTADDYVKRLYETVNLVHPSQLKPETIAGRLGLSVSLLPVSSLRINNKIYLDSRLPSTVQFEQFGHELCHALWHGDNQLHLSKSFIDMQERDANTFAYYACIPTSMLLALDLPDNFRMAVHRIATTFNVTPAFAMKRLENHLNKLYQTSS